MNVSTRNIHKSICFVYDIDMDLLLGRRRSKMIAEARLLGYWLTRKLRQDSYPMIARSFLRDDHTTIIHGAKLIEQRLATDVDLRIKTRRVLRNLEARYQIPAVDDPRAKSGRGETRPAWASFVGWLQPSSRA